MAEEWEIVKGENNDTHDFLKEAELVGKYISADSDVGPNESMLYTIKDKDGKFISIWGSTVIDGRMQKIEVGMIVKIVYKGYSKSPKTGRSYKDFDIMFKRDPESKEEPKQEALSEDVKADDIPF